MFCLIMPCLMCLHLCWEKLKNTCKQRSKWLKQRIEVSDSDVLKCAENPTHRLAANTG